MIVAKKHTLPSAASSLAAAASATGRRERVGEHVASGTVRKVIALAEWFNGAARLYGCLNEWRAYCKVHSSFGGWKLSVCWPTCTKGLADPMVDTLFSIW